MGNGGGGGGNPVDTHKVLLVQKYYPYLWINIIGVFEFISALSPRAGKN